MIAKLKVMMVLLSSMFSRGIMLLLFTIKAVVTMRLDLLLYPTMKIKK